MVCERIVVDGHAVIVCGRQRARKCKFCGLPASRLCDYTNGKKTCDAPLCVRCAVAIAPEVDYCPNHDRNATQGSLL